VHTAHLPPNCGIQSHLHSARPCHPTPAGSDPTLPLQQQGTAPQLHQHQHSQHQADCCLAGSDTKLVGRQTEATPNGRLTFSRLMTPLSSSLRSASGTFRGYHSSVRKPAGYACQEVLHCSVLHSHQHEQQKRNGQAHRLSYALNIRSRFSPG